MNRPPESLKPYANRLALQLSEQSARSLRRFSTAGLLSATENPAARSNGRDNLDEHPLSFSRVGIWKLRQENGKTSFVRNPQMQQEWHLWANVGRIEARGEKRRIVLIGESVARGFLYDPQFNPAMTLESVLHSSLGKENVEVIDLARTNLGREVRELALSALALRPDAVIIFSGNNSLDQFASSFLPDLESFLCQRGISGLKQWAERQLDKSIRKIMDDIASGYRAQGVPLIWIVPEFNLGDWKDVPMNAPHLPAGANHEWILCRQSAESALREGDFNTAARLARKMIELDEGTCRTSFYLLAECYHHLGMPEQRRQCLELARDSGIWDTSYPLSPRALSVMQKALREEAARHGNALVDLPAIFAGYLDGGIPDRRLFLDYCHMTVEGIQVAMAAAASHVLELMGGTCHSWRELMKSAASPSRRVKAEAAFLAAVHNAHYFQSADLVLHYCVQAIQAAPETARVMLYYVDMQARRTPVLMSRAAELISELESPLLRNYLLEFNSQRSDAVLLSAIVTATAKVADDASKKVLRLHNKANSADPNTAELLQHYENVVASLQEISARIRENLVCLRLKLHSVKERDIDLLSYYYCSSAQQPQELMWALKKGAWLAQYQLSQFYKAYGLESKFVFWDESGCAVDLHLTCRLPVVNQLSEGVAAIHVNGWHIGDIVLNQSWATWDISVPATYIIDDQNEIVVRWPMPEFPGMPVFETIADDLTQDIVPAFYCWFGEIHSFVASHHESGYSSQR